MCSLLVIENVAEVNTDEVWNIIVILYLSVVGYPTNLILIHLWLSVPKTGTLKLAK